MWLFERRRQEMELNAKLDKMKKELEKLWDLELEKLDKVEELEELEWLERLERLERRANLRKEMQEMREKRANLHKEMASALLSSEEEDPSAAHYGDGTLEICQRMQRVWTKAGLIALEILWILEIIELAFLFLAPCVKV